MQVYLGRNNLHLLLVLCAVRRQRRAMYAILAIFAYRLSIFVYCRRIYLVREIIAISLVDLRLCKVAYVYADYVRPAAEVE